MKKISKHDQFFKSIFKVKKNLKDFLENYLPKEIVNEINIKKIDYLDNSYIDKKLKVNLSDLVIKTKLKNGDDIDLYFLFEHKSYKDKKIFYQLIHYMNQMWLEDINNKRKLRNIIPLVFYHGKEKWNLRTNFIKNFNVSKSLSKYMLNFKYILFDISKKNYSEDSTNRNIFLLTAMLLMKTVKEKDIDKIREIFTIWREKGIIRKSDTIMIFIEYMISSSEIDKSKLLKLIDEELKKENIEMPTVAEQIRLEERDKIIMNMYHEKFDLKTIAKIVKISELKLKKVIETNLKKEE